MEKQSVVIAALVLLILISAMQGLQLSNIQNRLSGYAVAGTNEVQQPQASQQLPSNLQQLPQQIGGC
ncbi:MAG: hypothetical protein HYW27_03900 [Candidatus Aenigmarchaeota archaeon]|nr:hypothetical protein [Candidatus Aenigmarchaeota archaeon]